jgi:hypothetical protein
LAHGFPHKTNTCVNSYGRFSRSNLDIGDQHVIELLLLPLQLVALCLTEGIERSDIEKGEGNLWICLTKVRKYGDMQDEIRL